MRSPADAEEDRAPELTPPIQPKAPWRVTSVQPLPAFRLHVRFNDGTEGMADLSALINSDDAGVFSPLRDEKFFRRVAIRLGTVTWPGDLDLPPDAMHLAIRERGTWVA